MASLDSTLASLRIFGVDLDPAEITKFLGKPDFSQRKGDVRRSGHIVQSGSWSKRAPKASPGGLDGQVRGLLEDTPSDPELWKELNSKYSVDIFCSLCLEGTNEGLEISPETLSLLSDRGIKLGLDVYYRPSDPELED